MIIPDYVRDVNHRRVDRWHNAMTDDWTIGDWAMALTGELGEMFNVAKKLRRHQSGASTQYNTPEVAPLLDKFTEELADTSLYLDLFVLKMQREFDITDGQMLDALIDKFNKVSDAQGWPELTVERQEA